ncbi:putative leucine rich repeat-containing [Fasciolopsis buskii]|uniref:Putative leucine rich repeat-containing n=1 Tax=Fasciolopsis buskii TaxID=27845 RepID=A0A8E0S3U4_9TREM|nr:putative leucine rich repeat-containing [Fasciolopsis buski]
MIVGSQIKSDPIRMAKADTARSTNPDVPDSRKPKRVRFPDGEVISNYLEPFRPVPDNCTSEELIAAYVESCFQYKVSPIEFLLEQLKGIDLSICNERYSRLSLKGIRLNRSHVETLEEIFRRVHFRELDFEGTFLDDQSAVALFDMLLHYETCHELHISLNLDKFHPSLGWARCVTFMRRSGELRRFSLSHTPLTIGNFLGLNFFGLCLNGLSLRDCNLSGQALFGLVRWLRLLLSSASLDPPTRDRSNGAGNNGSRTAPRRSGLSSTGSNAVARRSHLWRPVLLMNPHTGMREPSVWELRLDVAQNRLNAADAETLLALIRHQLLVPQIPPDTPLSGVEQSIPSTVSDDHVDWEPTVLRKGWLPIGGIGYLSSLDLSNNSLGDDGLRVICTGLIQSYRTRLRDLHSVPTAPSAEDRPSVTDTSVSCSTLKDQIIGESEPDASVETVELQTSVRGLERLALSNNGLTATGMHPMALVLMQTPLSLVQLVGGLTSLDLSNNPGIRDEGVEVLCEGLIRNHSLRELYLRAIRMSFSGIFALSGFLSESKCLRILDIRYNQMNLAALMALSKTLYINRTLTSLLSDMRNMTATEDPLIATDAELILYLVDEIDGCLRRNRSLDQSMPPVIPKQTELPSSTSVCSLDVDPLSPNTSPTSNTVIPDPPTDQTKLVENVPDLSRSELECDPVEADSGSVSWSEKTLTDLRGSVEFPIPSPVAFSSEPICFFSSPPNDSVTLASQVTQPRDSAFEYATENACRPLSPDNPICTAKDYIEFDWDWPKPVQSDDSSLSSSSFDGPPASPGSESAETVIASDHNESDPNVISTASASAGITSRRTRRKHVKSNPSSKPVAT